VTGPDFEHFCRLVKDRSGLILTPSKGYLVESRLSGLARAEGLAGVPQLLEHLHLGGSSVEALLVRCVEAMATHESFFFRDGTPFNLLAARVLPQLIEARAETRTLRIWCAACSSGQEPYSIAILMKEMGVRLTGWRLEIVATDMSRPILKKAEEGFYSDFEVRRGLTDARRDRWFIRDGHGWRVSPELRALVSFRPHLAADGGLFLGSAETVLGVTDAFELTPGAAGLFRRSAPGRGVVIRA
jgi:chemotaxis protein methyltransferase CheR